MSYISYVDGFADRTAKSLWVAVMSDAHLLGTHSETPTIWSSKCEARVESLAIK